MLFKDVIGQHEVKQHLVEMVQHNRISHALLFLGKEGAGGLPLALAFANYISLLPLKNLLPEASLFGEPVEIKLPSTPDEADAWMQKQPAPSTNKAAAAPDGLKLACLEKISLQPPYPSSTAQLDVTLPSCQV